ncbi:GGDEF domain-containing protein [Thalassotalea psychrophila]|uniref:diguanylate cyclase n=1 Tax=Thalassotalea psychrophila TaxID=3065647 RepID=A0ABY9TVV1_9GAMM|nr:GGDEF domain-containing protein [Colwelliaceae bacterium SQ149]
MFISKIINTGAEFQPFNASNKIKTTNWVTLFTVIISATYTLLYLFILNEIKIGLLNLGFTIAYALGLVFMRFNAIKNAKLWFFTVLMLHVWICTNIFVTNLSGFHLFYFLVPTGAFLLFELDQQKEKVILSVLATLLFFYCQNTMNAAPLITLSDEVNNIIYQSVVFFIMLELVAISAMFNQQISHHEKFINKRAKTDTLTNCLNRNYFFEAGQEQLNLANLNGRPFSLILTNLDNFKRVNDKYGYLTGDEYLVHLAKLIKDLCIKGEIIGRISGEEFVITLPEYTKAEAEKFAQKLNYQIAKSIFVSSDNKQFSNTISMGVVVHNCCDTIGELVSIADTALFQAKIMGASNIDIIERTA